MDSQMLYPEVHIVGDKPLVDRCMSLLRSEREFATIDGGGLLLQSSDSRLDGMAVILRPYPFSKKQSVSSAKSALRLSQSRHSTADALVFVYDPFLDPASERFEACSNAIIAVGKPFLCVGIAPHVTSEAPTAVDVAAPSIGHPLFLGCAPWFPARHTEQRSSSDSSEASEHSSSSPYHTADRSGARLMLPDGVAMASHIVAALTAPTYTLYDPTSHSLTATGSAAFARLFYCIDFDGDGMLCRDEVATFVRLVHRGDGGGVAAEGGAGGEGGGGGDASPPPLTAEGVEKEVEDVMMLVAGEGSSGSASSSNGGGTGGVTLSGFLRLVEVLLSVGDARKVGALWGALRAIGTRLNGAPWDEGAVASALWGAVARATRTSSGSSVAAAAAAAAAATAAAREVALDARRCGVQVLRAQLVERGAAAAPLGGPGSAPRYEVAFSALQTAAAAAAAADGVRGGDRPLVGGVSGGAGGASSAARVAADTRFALMSGQGAHRGRLSSTPVSVYGALQVPRDGGGRGSGSGSGGVKERKAGTADDSDDDDDDSDGDAHVDAVPAWQSADVALAPSHAAVQFLERLASTDLFWCSSLWELVPGGCPFYTLWADECVPSLDGPIAFGGGGSRSRRGDGVTVGAVIAAWRFYMSVRDAAAFVRALMCWGWSLPLDAAVVAVPRRATRGAAGRGRVYGPSEGSPLFPSLGFMHGEAEVSDGKRGKEGGGVSCSSAQPSASCGTSVGTSDGLYVCLVLGSKGSGRRTLMRGSALTAPVGAPPVCGAPSGSAAQSHPSDTYRSCSDAPSPTSLSSPTSTLPRPPAEGLVVSFARAHLVMDDRGVTLHSPAVGGPAPPPDAVATAVDIAFVLVDDDAVGEVIGSKDGLMAAVDVALLLYDGSSSTSFAPLAEWQTSLESHTNLPTVYAITKIDLPVVDQTSAVRPDVFCEQRGLPWPPLRLCLPPSSSRKGGSGGDAASRSLAASVYESVATPPAELVAQLAVVAITPSLGLSNKAGVPYYTPAQKRLNRVLLVRRCSSFRAQR